MRSQGAVGSQSGLRKPRRTASGPSDAVAPGARRSAEELLAPFREALQETSDPQEVTAFLAALRQVETEAETRRLELAGAGHAEDQADRLLNTKEAAELLHRTVDWVQHHRHELQAAQVSPLGAHPRYSRARLIRLMDDWARRNS
jgi:hypothetical protein